MKINIISVDNGFGLSLDAAIIKDALKGHTFNFIDIYETKVLQKADVNIFLEVVDGSKGNGVRFLKLAPVNIFIPNPEWYYNEWNRSIGMFDVIFAKTHDCQRIFSKMHKNVVYTSFTSPDKYREMEKENFFLHLAGNSMSKGSTQIFNTFYNNDTKYKLIFSKGRNVTEFDREKSNILRCFTRFTDEQVLKLQNRCKFHVCCSIYEGFGHYINEAKSQKAIIITTDIAPMNEDLVTSDFGYLVDLKRTNKMRLATTGIVCEKSLYNIIEQVSSLTDKEIEEKGELARASYIKNDKYFRKTIKSIIDSV